MNGVEQSPLAGRLDALLVRRRAGAPTQKETQYYEMFGMRGALAQGLEGGHRARPDQRDEQLRERHAGSSSTPTTDRAEAHDLAEEHPEKVKELVELWFEEAKANNVLPLNDMMVVGE